MPRLFVFGIGGTGARVIKSLTMLLAAGVKAADFDIIPILIDPHETLDELNNCKILLRLYSEIQAAAYKGSGDIKKGFFHTRILPLSFLASAGTGIKDGFEMDGNYAMTFGEFIERINFAKNSPTEDFLSLLYSLWGNFNKPLSQGFKGNPNVGSIVMNTLTDSQYYDTFSTTFGAGDRIFIISSIFGGTGASGFPLLLKNFRQSTNMLIRDAQIGSLTVLPYYKLTTPNGDNGPESDIDSKDFLAKTKSALTYYVKNITGLNALYYIGDPDGSSKPYQNNEQTQPNGAHLVELLGAQAIMHFAGNSFTPEQQEVFEYCLDNDQKPVTFQNIGERTRKQIAPDLTSLYVLNRLHKSIKKYDRLPFRTTSDFSEQFFEEPFFTSHFERFMDEYFEPWLNELSNNDRPFNPFNISDSVDFRHSISGYKISGKVLPGIVSRPFDHTDLFINMAKNERTYFHLNKVNKPGQYLSMAYKAIHQSIKANVSF